jgi:methionine sulfoxide reductase heme-binding subunit
MNDSRSLDFALRMMTGALITLLAFVVGIALFLIARLPIGASLGNVFDALFALSSVQTLWYVTRAAGMIAYLLLWLSTVWGLAVSSKILDPFLERMFTYDLHEFLSLLAIGFVVLHVVVLLGDRYLPFSLAEILIPFVAPYRPLWVGVGIIAFYLTLLVSITFYIRRWIGIKTFRVIHIASFVSFFGAGLHGLLSGTDSPLPAAQLVYAGTTLVVVFITVYWVIMARLNRPHHAAEVLASEPTR